MDYLVNLIVDIECHSVEAIRECFANGVSPNDFCNTVLSDDADGSIITYQTLTYFEEKLSNDQFLRIHRSYIVSLNHISAYSATQIEIGKVAIPIGSSYAKEVVKKLNSK